MNIYVCIKIHIYIYIEHITFHITGWMIFPPIIRHAFWPWPLTSQPNFAEAHNIQIRILRRFWTRKPHTIYVWYVYCLPTFKVDVYSKCRGNIPYMDAVDTCGYGEYFRYWYWKNDMLWQQFWKNMHIANADFQCKIYYIHTKDIERQCSLCKNTFSPFIAMNARWLPNFAGMACAGHFPCCRLHQLGGTSWIFWECPGSMKSNYLT